MTIVSKMPFFSCLLLLFVAINALGQGSVSNVKITVTDHDTGLKTPVRVKVTDAGGSVVPLPDEAIAIMYGRDDRPERYGYQPDSSFYVDGMFTMSLAEGKYSVHLSKGTEYVDQYHTIKLAGGESKELEYEMKRWISMADSGWYSADDHIHIRRSPRENPLILKWVQAEGLDVGILLQMGDFWTTYFSQYAFGDEGVYSVRDGMLTSGQEEPRTHEIGHTIALVADEFVRFRDQYYYYDKYFDKVHELNGIMGYAHQGMSFNGYLGMTLDVLSGRVDFLELMQFCVKGGPLITQNYYHYLDLGYKLTATAGSDFPWCGLGPDFGVEGPRWNARIGNVRFYTHIDGKLTYNSWKENLKAGHTFVTSGPMIIFSVDGQLPGDEIDLKKKGTVTVTARAYGQKEQIPLKTLEIIAHGKVIKSASPGEGGQTAEKLELNFDLDIDHGIWIAARCFAGPNQAAHTTPIYISINNGGFINYQSYQDYLAKNEQYLMELEEKLKEPSDKAHLRAWWFRKGLKQRIAKTREIISILKEK